MSRLTSVALTATGLAAIAVALFGCASDLGIDIDTELPEDDETVVLPEASFIAVEPAQIGPPRELGVLRIAYANVAVRLDGDLAQTVVTEVVVNDLDTEVEASFRFPLPDDATVTDFAHWKDGARIGAAIGGKEEARREYERAAGAGEKAALAEETEGRHFEMTLAPLEAGGARRVELSYTQTLSALGGERTYALPTKRFDEHIPTLLDIDVDIRGTKDVAGASSQNHPDARIVRHGEQRMSVHLSRSRVALGRDFVVSYRQPAADLELDGRVAEGDRPAAELRFAFNRDPFESTRKPTTVALVIDHSLSMAGEPLARAQELGAAVIDALGPRDRIGMVGFSSAVSTRDLAAASDGHKDTMRRELAALVPGGYSSLDAALDEAIAMVAGQAGALIVIATDGQPTVGEDLDRETASARDLGSARVVVAHFNYPSRGNLLTQLLPGADLRFVPDGDAGGVTVAALAKLAVAPTIENLVLKVTGVDDATLVGAIPDKLAMGDSIRVLARATGPVAVTVSGQIHGEPISLHKVLETKSGLGKAIETEWARVRIAELERRYLAGESALHDEITELGVNYRLATRFTSFVATDRYEEGDSLSPDRIMPGDPEIRIRADRAAARVFGVLPTGEIIECSWQDDEGLWLGRFLVPRGTPDGLYRIRVFVADQKSTLLRSSLLYRVDSAPPTFKLEATYAGGVISIVATPISEVFDEVGDSVRLDRVDLKRLVVRLGSGPAAREVALEQTGEVRWSAEMPAVLAAGAHVLTLTAVDYASNSSQSSTTVEVE